MNRWRIACALALALALPTAAFPAGDPTPPPENLTGSPYDQGRNQVNMGNWGKAAELFQKAVEKDPRDYKAYNMLGYALRKLDKPKEALQAYNRALSLRPDYAPALEYRGVAHLMLKNRRAAIADYESLRRLGSPLAQDLKEQIDQAPAN